MKSINAMLCVALMAGFAHSRRSREVDPMGQDNIGAAVHQIKMALLATSGHMSKDQASAAQSFVQRAEGGPVSLGEINGILQNMLDNYRSDLASAIEKENKEADTNDKFQSTLSKEFDELDAELTKKQGILADNDAEMADKRTVLGDSKQSLSDTQKELATQTESCAVTTQEYDTQKSIRMKEDEAITAAIAILDSDAAFQTFDKNVKKDIAFAEESTAPSFLQTRAHPSLADIMQHVTQLRKLKGNAFAPVIDLLERNIARVNEETQDDFRIITDCRAQKEKNDGDREKAKEERSAIELDISNLKSQINDEPDGLKPEVRKLLKDLDVNADDKAKAVQRFRDNMAALTSDVEGKSDAVNIIDKAVEVLGGFYQNYLQQTQQGFSFMQEPEFDGQQGQGNAAIETLEKIKSATVDGINEDHEAMMSKQKSLEEDLTDLRDSRDTLESNLAKEKATLADKIEDLSQARSDRDLKDDEIAAINRLASAIKPKCDYFRKNEEIRNKSRTLELEELNFAIDQLKNSAEYKKEVEAEQRKKLGSCASRCMEADEKLGEVNVAACEACKERIPVAEYCAAHNEEPVGCAELTLSFVQIEEQTNNLLAFDRAYTNLTSALARRMSRGHSSKNPITGVVEMLQEMLEKSKEQGESLREAFAKDICACNSGTREKNARIEELQATITSADARIEHLRADTKQLSQDCAKLTQDKEDNEKARSDASSERTKAHEAFTELKSNLEAGIDSMKGALTSLGSVGADQTAGSSKDHEKFMANYK